MESVEINVKDYLTQDDVDGIIATNSGIAGYHSDLLEHQGNVIEINKYKAFLFDIYKVPHEEACMRYSISYYVECEVEIALAKGTKCFDYTVYKSFFNWHKCNQVMMKIGVDIIWN